MVSVASIQYPSLLFPNSGSQGSAGSLSQQCRPWTDHRSIIQPHVDGQPRTLTIAPKVNLESLASLHVHVHIFEVREEPSHRKSPKHGFKPGTFQL